MQNMALQLFEFLRILFRFLVIILFIRRLNSIINKGQQKLLVFMDGFPDICEEFFQIVRLG